VADDDLDDIKRMRAECSWFIEMSNQDLAHALLPVTSREPALPTSAPTSAGASSSGIDPVTSAASVAAHKGEGEREAISAA
jgi:hypothetical protein